MNVTSLHRTLGLAATLLALVSACSPAAAPVSDSPRDPSNPHAPEGMTPTVVASAALAPPPAAAAPAHDHHDHGAANGEAGVQQGVVYECPMHPEVTSSAPGVCPKCNMKLVPKK